MMVITIIIEKGEEINSKHVKRDNSNLFNYENNILYM